MACMEPLQPAMVTYSPFLHIPKTAAHVLHPSPFQVLRSRGPVFYCLNRAAIPSLQNGRAPDIFTRFLQVCFG